MWVKVPCSIPWLLTCSRMLGANMVHLGVVVVSVRINPTSCKYESHLVVDSSKHVCVCDLNIRKGISLSLAATLTCVPPSSLYRLIPSPWISVINSPSHKFPSIFWRVTLPTSSKEPSHSSSLGPPCKRISKIYVDDSSSMKL